jgi:diaminopimelate epimerase
MQFQVQKYQATGNDFVIIDNRESLFPTDDSSLIQKLCHRKFGIGADGLILLEKSEIADFIMKYYNADGSLGSFCGNGSRAIVHFARSLGLIESTGSFEAFDGLHKTIIDGDLIQINMADVQNGIQLLNGTFLDTGSPHYIEFVNDVENLDVVQLGKKLRYSSEFAPNGSNINFVEKITENEIKVRTYERGVENETLSCGTGVTAAAIAASPEQINKVTVSTTGGQLSVEFEKFGDGYQNVWLKGPAELVFSSEIDI